MKNIPLRGIQIGDKYNKLTCVAYKYRDKHNTKFFLFKCDCGKEKIMSGPAVKSGHSKSCGCLKSGPKHFLPKGHVELTNIIGSYKGNAQRRGYKWIMSRAFVQKITQSNCYYCGAPPSNVKRVTRGCPEGLLYTGIDRIDNSKDYTEDNVVPCCGTCNYAKHTLSLEAFQRWAIRLGKKATETIWKF